VRSVGSWGIIILAHVLDSVLKGGGSNKKKKAKKAAAGASPERDDLEGVSQTLLALLSK
jgi:hypothetical protein